MDQSALELLAVKYHLASAYVTRALSTTGFLLSDTPVLLYLQNEVGDITLPMYGTDLSLAKHADF